MLKTYIGFQALRSKDKEMLQNSFLQHLLLVFYKEIKRKALRWRLKGAY